MYRYVLILSLVFSCKKSENAAKNETGTDTTSNNNTRCQDPALGLTAIFDKSGNEIDDSEVDSGKVNWQVLLKANPLDAIYNGVGMYPNPGCSSALIKTKGSSSRPAYILTNGHCTININGSSIRITTPQTLSSKKVIFNFFCDSIADSQTLPIKATRVLYASMNKTDVSIVELDKKYEEIIALGIKAYSISPKTPSKGTAITMVGIPQSGLVSAHYNLKKATCNIGDTVELYEGKFEFSQSFRHQCSIVGGSSGSPIFSTSTGEIVGINNTAVNDNAMSLPDCSLDKPCEAHDGKKASVENQNYGQYVAFLAPCFDADGTFDPTAEGCDLL